ncbi:DoxX family protein [Streptomyces candidus]|uniref:Putative membrane protein YphA (DoxX/SURF4 family) n=1 Tax=Streptomyces candidus TaxID=67283 RepID=A0A7X0LPP3_9ACTN|nr:DoxX family protein [Streptomyces candidus]MBB6435674.1 putative membrane protein YphA (DoxX/SURF4 family) [Streptomyces candidus]GHH46571.1 membrane protein [Streptomyces candidus]
MSVDTRTPGFDDQPALSMVKVPCDPAQVIVNHASFRVQLAPTRSARPTVVRGGLDGTAMLPALSGAGVGAGAAAAGAAAGRRRAPVMWSGKSEPGDPGAGGLLQAVRGTTDTDPDADLDTGATQLIPHIGSPAHAPDDTMQTPVVDGGQGGAPHTRMLPRLRQAEGAYDTYETDEEPYDEGEVTDGRRKGDARARHPFYPDRRMNLGVVLLPLRIFLGLISVYAGMGKLCDPVFFDGGERGSMVKWLNSLHPWALAEPLRDFALQHPVGAGLSVAFLQVVVGVLTILGLWQRVAGVIGALLSAALLLTVSWKSVPAYDAPDIIYLAAWSPLVIAGAPVYSLDSRLAGEAWRTLGPRSEVWELRRRVLRRGFLMVTLVVGLTLLVGSVLGGAVRSAEVVVPGPEDDPVNHLPGRPLATEPGAVRTSEGPRRRAPSPAVTGSVRPSSRPSVSGPPRATSTAGAGSTAGPSQSTSGSTGRAPTRDTAPAATTGGGPTSTAGPTTSGGTTTGGNNNDAEPGGSSSSGGSASGGSGSGGSGSGGSGSGGSGSGGSGSGGSERVIGGLLG